jgi:hypothetical protein
MECCCKTETGTEPLIATDVALRLDVLFANHVPTKRLKVMLFGHKLFAWEPHASNPYGSKPSSVKSDWAQVPTMPGGNEPAITGFLSAGI